MHHRLAIRFAIEGDLRFISHHDTLRLFKRALARAAVDVRYSAGFNPQPKLTIVLPRPVGVVSKDELLVVGMASEVEPSGVLAGLAEQMPQGVRLHSAEALPAEARPRPCGVCYELPIESELAPRLRQRVSEFLSQDSVVIERESPKRKKMVDLRTYVVDCQVEPDRLTWRQLVSQDGTARLAEVLEALGLPAQDHLHRLCRTQVEYER